VIDAAPARAGPSLEALRRGDGDAWEAVAREFGPRLLAVARRFLTDPQTAQDCLQEALVRAYESIGRFEERSALSTWLHRIVVNEALMILRSRRRRPEESLDDLLPVFDESGHRLPSGPTARDPEDMASDEQSMEIVREAIDRLPDSYRMVLLLRDLEELSTEETARLLDASPGAVKVRLHRARAALKTLLERPAGKPSTPAWERVSRRISGAITGHVPFLITCREFEDFIVGFLDGTLTGRERALFEIHLRTCRVCRHYLVRYRRTVELGRLCREEDVPLPSDAPRRLIAAIALARSRPT
jgi:RNA polymerase sigma-70 factor (ECF subfamily)